MGWQRDDPTSDFRGGGLFSLQLLLSLGQVNFLTTLVFCSQIRQILHGVLHASLISMYGWHSACLLVTS